MPNFTTPDKYKDLAFTLITSPLGRSGTTFLQRLLNSSSDMIVYGENQSVILRQIASFFCDLLVQAIPQQDYNQQRIDRILSGDVNFWHPDLLPDIQQYVDHWTDFFYGTFVKNQQFSQSIERPIWGIKQPGLDQLTIGRLSALLPQMKIIYIYRNIYDVISSIKTKESDYNITQTQALAEAWCQHLQFLQHPLAKRDSCLILCYEEIFQQPQQTLEKLQNFTGANNMSADVFSVKINNWPDDTTKEEYVQQSQLSVEENDIITKAASGIMQHYYPGYIHR